MDALGILLSAAYALPAIAAASKGHNVIALGWALQATLGGFVRLLWTIDSDTFTTVRAYRHNVLIADKVVLLANFANVARMQVNGEATLSRGLAIAAASLVLMKIVQMQTLPVGCKAETLRQLIDNIWLGGGVVLVLRWTTWSLQ